MFPCTLCRVLPPEPWSSADLLERSGSGDHPAVTELLGRAAVEQNYYPCLPHLNDLPSQAYQVCRLHLASENHLVLHVEGGSGLAVAGISPGLELVSDVVNEAVQLLVAHE